MTLAVHAVLQLRRTIQEVAGIRLRVALLLVSAIAAVGLVACGGSNSQPTRTPFEATLSNGEVIALMGEVLCPKNPPFATGTLSASFNSDTGDWKVVDDADVIFTVVDDGGQVIAENDAAQEMLSNYGSFAVCTD